MTSRALLALAAGLVAVAAYADDWPQFRGPDRDGVSKETGLLKKWPQGGPKLAWTWKEAGTGFSAPAIVGDRLYLSGARGDDEFVYALDLTQNPPKELWATKLAPKYTWKANTWNEGPIAAPTVAGDLVFALASGGELVCVDAKSGKEKWRRSLLKDLKGDVYNFHESAPKGAGWGFACAPLVDGDKVICVPGGKEGTLAALDRTKGDVLWRSKDVTDPATYASPILATIGGTKQYLQMTNQGVAAVDGDGKLLWYYKRPTAYGDIVGSPPVVKGDHVLISGAGGDDAGCDLIEVKQADGKFTATKVYANKEFATYHGGMVLVGDHVYTSSGTGLAGDVGKWLCMDFKTGKIEWTVNNRRFGKGPLIAADGYLYCVGESQDLIVHAPASPTMKLAIAESFKLPETSERRKSQGRLWTYPAIANGKLYIRDQELLFCYEVK
jgi:outer membrane protein assembly factor BamB